MFKPKLSELFLASFKFEDYSPLHTKILLLNAMLFITALTNLFFGIYNLFIINLYSVSLINFSILALISYAIYVLRQNEKLFAFFILDLDHFKQYNDTYGHQNGDKILQEIAQILKKNLDHHDDYAFRLGGDEFVGILMGNKIEDIHNKINMIMDEEIKQLEQDSNPILTCSIGAYIVDDFTYAFEEIYTLADEALYQAKNTGRNRVLYKYKTS